MATNETNYWQRQLSRRMVLRGAGAAVAGLGALALAGCSGGEESAKAPTSTPAPPKAELIKLNLASPQVTVYDAETRELKRSADIPNFFVWSWNTPRNYFDGQNLWLGAFSPIHSAPDFDGAELILLNLDTLAVTKRIPIGKEGTVWNAANNRSNGMLTFGHPAPDGRLYVGKMMVGEVSVIDVKSQTVVMSKKVTEGGGYVCDSDFGVASDGVGRLYLATNNTRKVYLVDPKTLEILQTYTAPEGVQPYMLTVAPAGDRVWVQNSFAASFAGERLGLTILDTKTLAVIKQIDTGKTPNYNGFSPDGKLAYVTHGNGPYVSVFDAASLAEIRRVEVGTNATMVAAHPDGKSIFVRVSGKSNYIVRVDTSTWQAGEPFGELPVPTQAGLFMRRLA